MKKQKSANNKGITLIALVVTIVVLLIITGVSVSMFTGDNGIISQAKKAKEETTISEEKEQVETKYVSAEGKKVATNEPVNSTDVQQEFDNENIDVTVEGTEILSVKFNGTGNVYRILTDGKVVGPIDPDATIPWSITLNATRTMYYATLQVTTSNLKEENGQLYYKYYIRNLTSGEQTYELKYQGSDTTYKYEGLSYSNNYEVKVEAMDELGNIIIQTIVPEVQCFLSGTQILTETGMKNIEDIKVGDRVYSINIDNNQKELKQVIDLYQGQSNEIYELTIGEEVIKTTPKHQFYVVDKGWIRAYELKEGDRIVAKDNSNLIINKIEYKYYEEPLSVYNLTVEGYHNYLITQYELLVHNAGSPTT
jgi:Tfp pilus assembly protein PilE